MKSHGLPRTIARSLSFLPGLNGLRTTSCKPARPLAITPHGNWLVSRFGCRCERCGHGDLVESQDCRCRGSFGVPPDILNPAGQDWVLSPFDPSALKQEGYATPVGTREHAQLRRTPSRPYIVGLPHLYWIPEDHPPSDGGLCDLSL